MENNESIRENKFDDLFNDFFKSYRSAINLTKKQRNKIYETLLLNLEVYPLFSCLDFSEHYAYFTVNSAYSHHDLFPISQLPELQMFHPVWDEARQYETYPKRGSSWFVEEDKLTCHREHKRMILLFCYTMTL